jgi:phosphoribosylformimino-5-aminoimidazole carboxamide ribotide isomerase
MILIPAIDLKEGKCVRLEQGLMDKDTVFSDRPVEMATQWVDQGCKRLHVIDLDGAFAGKPVNASIIEEMCSTHPNLPVQIGGGIRNMETVEAYIKAGVSWCIIGTQAVRDPEFVKQACKAFPNHIIVGLDAKKGMVAVEGWAEVSSLSAVNLAKEFEDDGVSAIVYTDIARDGMMQGVNIEETQALAQAISIPVIASGGMTNMDDVIAVQAAEKDGVMGAILGRSLYDGTIDLQSAQAFLDKG